jgi:hypothetical protein
LREFFSVIHIELLVEAQCRGEAVIGAATDACYKIELISASIAMCVAGSLSMEYDVPVEYEKRKKRLM